MRGLHWFRNDLRLDDNQALAALAERVEEWLPVFVLDPSLLARNPLGLPRTRFLLDCLTSLGSELAARGIPLQILEGRPEVVIPRLARDTRSRLVSWNQAPTPVGQRRDALRRMPQLPLEEEGRLHDLPLREAFIEAIFSRNRWRVLVSRMTKPPIAGWVSSSAASVGCRMRRSTKAMRRSLRQPSPAGPRSRATSTCSSISLGT